MTNSHDTEIATVARKLAKTIADYTQIMQQLAAIGKKIEGLLDNPESEKFDGMLGIIANGTDTAAIISESITNRIRLLSATLRSLLDDKKEIEND